MQVFNMKTAVNKHYFIEITIYYFWHCIIQVCTNNNHSIVKKRQVKKYQY